MSKAREFKVGDIVYLRDGRKAQAVEQYMTCDGCIYDGVYCKSHFLCKTYLHKGNVSVIFKEIKSANKTTR